MALEAQNTENTTRPKDTKGIHLTTVKKKKAIHIIYKGKEHTIHTDLWQVISQAATLCFMGTIKQNKEKKRENNKMLFWTVSTCAKWPTLKSIMTHTIWDKRHKRVLLERLLFWLQPETFYPFWKIHGQDGNGQRQTHQSWLEDALLWELKTNIQHHES